MSEVWIRCNGWGRGHRTNDDLNALYCSEDAKYPTVAINAKNAWTYPEDKEMRTEIQHIWKNHRTRVHNLEMLIDDEKHIILDWRYINTKTKEITTAELYSDVEEYGLF